MTRNGLSREVLQYIGSNSLTTPTVWGFRFYLMYRRAYRLGIRSATEKSAENPYSDVELRGAWTAGRKHGRHYVKSAQTDADRFLTRR